MKTKLELITETPEDHSRLVAILQELESDTEALADWSSGDIEQARYVCEGSIGFGSEGSAPRILDYWMDHEEQPVDMKVVADEAKAGSWRSASSTVRVFKRLAQEVGRTQPWSYGAGGLAYMPTPAANAFRAARAQLRSEGNWPSK